MVARVSPTQLARSDIDRRPPRAGGRPVVAGTLRWQKRGTRTHRAVRRLLARLLVILEQHEYDPSQVHDSERLHEYRIALRRSRTLLAESETVLGQDRVRHLRQELRWLSAATSGARDMDVFLHRAGKLGLPEAALGPLQLELRRRRDAEYQKLSDAQHSARYAGLKDQWRALTRKPPAKIRRRRAAQRRIKRFANASVTHVAQRVLKRGRGLDPAAPDTLFHDLRKNCKKLRYLLELFVALKPTRKTRRLIRELKLVQARLGDFQDLGVQIEFFSQERERVNASDNDAGGFPAAIDEALSALRNAQRRQKMACVETWHNFARRLERATAC